ncbi:MAG: CvpA family protein [Tannerella sp.]|jgi:membrane protein required for colicin V production|nr:CvpA family protein [Tannerella sp.]
MNWLDIVILILVGIGLVKGLIDGVVKQLVSLAALILGFVLCQTVASYLQGWMSGWSQSTAIITSYIFGFLLIVSVVFLAGWVINKIVDATPLSIINHLMGGITGVVIVTLFISFAFNVIEAFDTDSSVIPQAAKVESRFYNYVRSIIPAVTPDSWFG